LAAVAVLRTTREAAGSIERTFGLFSREPLESAGLFSVVAGSLLYSASLDVDHPHDHCAVRLEGQILKSPSATERAHGIVDRVCDNIEAADLSGSSERRALREEKERTGMALSLMILVDRESEFERLRPDVYSDQKPSVVVTCPKGRGHHQRKTERCPGPDEIGAHDSACAALK
jgi:hypothetical protein